MYGLCDVLLYFEFLFYHCVRRFYQLVLATCIALAWSYDFMVLWNGKIPHRALLYDWRHCASSVRSSCSSMVFSMPRTNN